jgi:iron(III) transport system permease protein
MALTPSAAGTPRPDWRSGESALLAILVAITLLLAVAPVLRLLIESAFPTAGGGPAVAVLKQAATWNATRRTLEVTIGGTLLAAVVGTIMALLAALTDIRARPALVFGFVLPLMIPPQVTAIAWLQVFGPSSPLLKMLDMAPPIGSRNPLYSRDGIILLLGIHYAPLVFLTLRAGLRRLPRDFVEAALATGASPLRVVATIVVPIMIPALIAGVMLTLVSCVGNFGIPALLGIPGGYTVLTTLIYQRLAGLGPRVLADVATLSVLIGVVVFVGIWAQAWLLRRGDSRISGTSAEAPRFELGRWRLPAEILAWALVLFTFVLPMLALTLTSLVPAYGVKLTAANATLENYRFVIFDHGPTRRAFVNSFLLSAGAALLLIALSLPLGHFIARRGGRLLGGLAFTAELPYALPGVVLAIACILLFLKPLPLLGFSLYNTVWIILVAYLMRFLILVLRPVVAAFQQLDRSYEEAAQMAGARFAFRQRTVSLPMVAPAAAAGALIVFLTAFNELTVSALLWSSGAETLGVAVFSLEQGGESTYAAALSALSVVATIAIMALGAAIGRRMPQGVVPWRD